MRTEVATTADAGLVDLIESLASYEDDEVLDVLQGLQRAQSKIAWAESQALVRLAGPYSRTHEVVVFDRRIDTERIVLVTDEVRDEVAAALHRSPNLVHDQITSARLLNGHLADTARALLDGSVTPAHVRVIVDQVRRHPAAVHCANHDPEFDSPAQAVDRREFDRLCRQLQEKVLPIAGRQTVAQTKALARRTMAAIDAEGERRRREAARSLRDVWVSADDDGLATLVARLDAVTAHAIREAVNEAAADPEVVGECQSNVGERRAEALAALVLGRAEVAIEIQLAVPLDEALDDAGPLAALLDDADDRVRVRRLITDPVTGTAVDLGRSRYEISEALRRWIVARDRTCRFPGCRRRASACQVDHVEAWEDGGGTDAANLQALCTRHHQLKTHRGWQVTRDDDTGRTTWVSPMGRVYVVDPEQVLIPPVRKVEPDPDPPPF